MGCSRRTFVRSALGAAGGLLTLAAVASCGTDDQATQEPAAAAPVVEAPAPDPAEVALASMTLEQKVAQLLVTTPEGLLGAVDAEASASDSYGVNGVVTVGKDLEQALLTYPVGGFCLFGANIVGKNQTLRLLADLKSATVAAGARVAPLVCIDEEGGPLVARIANSALFGVPDFPSMAKVGATGDVSQAREVGQTIGTYLHDIGFTVDFAPVADVLTNPGNTVIGSRSFGSDPELVASMVKAEVEGFLPTGVACCVKHFPGHGDTEADSHVGMAVTTRTREQMDACEFLPFRAAIEAGVPMVMVGHISTPKATGKDLPATLSPEAIDGILRQDLGFEGVVISDAMSMAAIGQGFTSAQAAVAFLAAGGDVILKPQDLAEAYQGILDAVAAGTLTEDRLDQSVRRVLALKQALGLL